MHADFCGSEGSIYYGIPFVTVDSDPLKAQTFPPGPTSFVTYPTESDKLAGEVVVGWDGGQAGWGGVIIDSRAE